MWDQRPMRTFETLVAGSNLGSGLLHLSVAQHSRFLMPAGRGRHIDQGESREPAGGGCHRAPGEPSYGAAAMSSATSPPAWPASHSRSIMLGEALFLVGARAPGTFPSVSQVDLARGT